MMDAPQINGHRQGLASYLSELSGLVKQHFGQPRWIHAEITHIQHKKHAYLELVESNGGSVISKCSAIIYSGKANSLQAKFKASIGCELSASMKVLVQVTASFHKEYGFSLVVQDIDPAYTLGDMQQQIELIRRQLKERNLYDCNRAYCLPVDFFNVAVLSPEGAAGLGDFRSDADKLAKTGAVTFDYYTAKFQGPETSNEILAQLRQIYSVQKNQQKYDCLCIVRGGGAKTDLASLNVLEIANAICRMNLPVVVGIGHERDQTILDEVASVSLDTPSKVVGHIVKSLRNRLSIYEAALKNIE
ncbi:MAG: exodeoxyribonuclease VII large subunit, partial [Pseudomonadales bacterium]|nr:exodeoxyribonuclease VII large subunit [Pseudomonadales bacterium]